MVGKKQLSWGWLHMVLDLQAHRPTALGFEKERLRILDFQGQRPMILGALV